MYIVLCECISWKGLTLDEFTIIELLMSAIWSWVIVMRVNWSFIHDVRALSLMPRIRILPLPLSLTTFSVCCHNISWSLWEGTLSLFIRTDIRARASSSIYHSTLWKVALTCISLVLMLNGRFLILIECLSWLLLLQLLKWNLMMMMRRRVPIDILLWSRVFFDISFFLLVFNWTIIVELVLCLELLFWIIVHSLLLIESIVILIMIRVSNVVEDTRMLMTFIVCESLLLLFSSPFFLLFVHFQIIWNS